MPEGTDADTVNEAEIVPLPGLVIAQVGFVMKDAAINVQDVSVVA